MTLIRGMNRQRLDDTNRPPGCRASSAGIFAIRADGTARFDRHYHDVDEFWFVAAGTATVVVGNERIEVIPGDIIYTPAGTEHDVTGVGEQLMVFWLTWEAIGKASARHLHRDPANASKHTVPVVATLETGGRRHD